MIISDQVGYYAAAFCIGIVLALIVVTLQQRGYGWAPIYGSLLLLHPAWTMGVMSGDCGLGKRFNSGLVCILLLAVLVCHVFWPGMSKRRFVTRWCAVFWIAYLSCRIYNALPLPSLLPYRDDFTFYGELCSTLLLSWPNLLRFAVISSFVLFIWWLVDRIRNKLVTSKVEPGESIQF